VTIERQPKRSGGGVLFNTRVAGWRVDDLAVQEPASVGIRGLTGRILWKIGLGGCEKRQDDGRDLGESREGSHLSTTIALD
jgi:hypothetical protein